MIPPVPVRLSLSPGEFAEAPIQLLSGFVLIPRRMPSSLAQPSDSFWRSSLLHGIVKKSGCRKPSTEIAHDTFRSTA